MSSMNKRVNLPGIQKIMMEFEKQSEIMDMKEEMMNDAIDDAMDEEEDEEESDMIVNRVLDEIGINLADSLGSAPKAEANTAAAEQEDDLEARLANLRKA